jgi:glyoxylase-like metal-dependent hydrolase (beta-lactamase superfamily II)
MISFYNGGNDMDIHAGITLLKLTSTILGKSESIYPTLIRDRNSSILIDTGYPGQLPLLQEAIEKAGSSLAAINKIVLSHQDLDHIGNLPTILESTSSRSLEVIAPILEKPYIQGEQPLQKLTPEAISVAIESLPPDVPEQWKRAFQHTLENPPKAKVDTTITGGDILPYLGGIEVIDTPGHTIGHVSFYHPSSKTLIAGDALIVEENQLFISDPLLCYDMDQALHSVEQLTDYDIQTVLCYHGGLYTKNTSDRILELARGYNMYRKNK